jgi:ankyrin repeat protein
MEIVTTQPLSPKAKMILKRPTVMVPQKPNDWYPLPQLMCYIRELPKDDLIHILENSEFNYNVCSYGDKNTPLHYAYFYKDIDIIIWLLQHGANPYTNNCSGKSMSMIAMQDNNLKVLDAIIDHYNALDYL